MKKIVIFAGKHTGSDEYEKLAYELGRLLALNSYTVVTGAGPGLMNLVLKGAHEAGGQTIGVGLHIEGREQSLYAKDLSVYLTLEERQAKLIEHADAFVVLPGGIGTMYETFEILIKKTFKKMEPTKPLILVTDFYDHIGKFLQQIEEQQFTNSAISKMFSVADNAEEVVKTLNKYFN